MRPHAAFGFGRLRLLPLIFLLLYLILRLWTDANFMAIVPQRDQADTNSTSIPRASAVLIVDNSSILLTSAKHSFSSPNGAYLLTLQPSGDLVLEHKEENSRPVWWTSTGDNKTRDSHRVTLTKDDNGHRKLSVDAKLGGSWSTVWHSDLEPTCKTSHGLADSEGKYTRIAAFAEAPLGLELSDGGVLSILGQCNLYVPPKEPKIERSLAIIVAGLYRTNNVTCSSHTSQLIRENRAFNRVDVFAYMLFEDTVVTDPGRATVSIESAVRQCYGEALRSIKVLDVAEVEEPYPGGAEAMLHPCGNKLQRLNNQLKTIYLAAKLWWEWSVQHGYLHDTVLRIRPDTNFWGIKPPSFYKQHDLGDNVLVLPHPGGEHYFYCATMSGRVGVGKFYRHREQGRMLRYPRPNGPDSLWQSSSNGTLVTHV